MHTSILSKVLQHIENFIFINLHQVLPLNYSRQVRKRKTQYLVNSKYVVTSDSIATKSAALSHIIDEYSHGVPNLSSDRGDGAWIEQSFIFRS